MIEIPNSQKEISTFSLMRTRKDCYYPPTQVDFTPLRRGNVGEAVTEQCEISILPTFNKDANFFTPSFIIPYEESGAASAESRANETKEAKIEVHRQKFLRKVQHADPSPMCQNPQFNPRGDDYCSICKQSFHCYWQHVNCAKHRRLIKNNKFNLYIRELCGKFWGGDDKVMRGASPAQGKKRMSKKNKKALKTQQVPLFDPEELIIRLPSQLWSKEGGNLNYGVSTNGLNSGDDMLQICRNN